MEKFFSLEYGIAGVCVILTIQLVVRVGEFLWTLREKKDSVSEATLKTLTETLGKNTYAVEHLDLRLRGIEQTLSEIPKLKNDLRRYFVAVKLLSGENWPKIKAEMAEEQ